MYELIGLVVIVAAIYAVRFIFTAVGKSMQGVPQVGSVGKLEGIDDFDYFIAPVCNVDGTPMCGSVDSNGNPYGCGS